MWWLPCKQAVDAPPAALQPTATVWAADNDISQSATQAFSHHLWYLTAELVPLALLSSWVPISECQALAEVLLEVQATSELQSPQNCFGSGRGKPQFPSVINLTSRLCDFVGVDSVDSWFTMSCLQVYCLWLSGTPAVNVVNDGAEWGVRLVTDLVDTGRSDKHFQNVL